MTHSPITDERLAEIIAGLEGVTPGPWRAARPAAIDYRPHHIIGRDGASIIAILYGGGPRVAIDSAEEERNAAHLARCSPDTWRAVEARIRQAEARAREQDEARHFFDHHLQARTRELKKVEAEAGALRTENELLENDALRAERDNLQAQLEQLRAISANNYDAQIEQQAVLRQRAEAERDALRAESDKLFNEHRCAMQILRENTRTLDEVGDERDALRAANAELAKALAIGLTHVQEAADELDSPSIQADADLIREVLRKAAAL